MCHLEVTVRIGTYGLVSFLFFVLYTAFIATDVAKMNGSLNSTPELAPSRGIEPRLTS